MAITNGQAGTFPESVDLPRPPAQRGRLVDRPVAGTKRVLLAAPRGYCAGVDRAVIAVEKALDHYGAPVYVRKQIVHNEHVVELEKRGAIFVEELDEVPHRPTSSSAPTASRPAVVKAAADRELAGDRRHLPARHQGAPRCAPERRRDKVLVDSLTPTARARAALVSPSAAAECSVALVSTAAPAPQSPAGRYEG